MSNQPDITNLPDGASYDKFLTRQPTGVQIGDDSQFVNPYSVPTQTSPTTTTTTPKTTTSAVTSPAWVPPSPVDSSYQQNLPIGPSYDLTSNGNPTQVAVKSGSQLSDVWISNFIKSNNWKSKSQGFWIDGKTGSAEFNNVWVTGKITATTGLIGGFITDATTIHNILNTISLNSLTDTISAGVLFPLGSRIELNGTTSSLNVYNSSNILRTTLDANALTFYDSAGNMEGEIYGGTAVNGGTLEFHANANGGDAYIYMIDRVGGIGNSIQMKGGGTQLYLQDDALTTNSIPTVLISAVSGLGAVLNLEPIDHTTLPYSNPIAGSIAFDIDTHFYVCQVTGSWALLI